MILLLQVGAPLALICFVAMPSGSRALKVVQTIGVAAYILAVHLAGLWLDLPWWTVWLLWAAFALALLRRNLRTRRSRLSRMRPIALVSWTALGAFAGWLASEALLGRVAPPGAVDLAFPLAPGDYLVVNGGSRPIVNAHLKTLHPETARQALYRGQSYGVDLIALRPDGRPTAGWRPAGPAAHRIFGARVLSPCTGVVVRSLDARPDMPVPVPDLSLREGNHVILRCGSVQVLLAHFRKGSVAVRQGDRVRTGQPLGEVGNSGASDAPHLHVHAQRPGAAHAPFAADPLPTRFAGRYLVRGDRL